MSSPVCKCSVSLAISSRKFTTQSSSCAQSKSSQTVPQSRKRSDQRNKSENGAKEERRKREGKQELLIHTCWKCGIEKGDHGAEDTKLTTSAISGLCARPGTIRLQ